MTIQRYSTLDKSQLRTCAIALDTEAENVTDRVAMAFGDARRVRELAEYRAKLWRAAKLLRELAS